MGLTRINSQRLTAALCPLLITHTAVAGTPKGPYIVIEGGVVWTGPLTFEPLYYNYTIFYPCALNHNSINFDVGYTAGVDPGSFGLLIEYVVSDRFGLTLGEWGLGASSVSCKFAMGSAGGGATKCAQTGTTIYDYWNGAPHIVYTSVSRHTRLRRACG